MDDKIFREQIAEDIALIQENLSWDTNIKKDEYAFNYWVLSNIYNLDEEECNGNITEYNDKGIDCFVHYKEDKELYIIQNKYYAENTVLNSKDVSDFLTRPIASLDDGEYKRSAELQKIYNLAKKDDEYKIFLHFYVTNNSETDDITNLINNQKNTDIITELFYLEGIKDKYYGISYQKNLTLETSIGVRNKGTYLAIRPQEYALPNMSEAYYVMAKISDIFTLWRQAEKAKYPLFEKNIREYLGGTSGINKAIIDTLKNSEERGNFFYYNNGITIICDAAKADAKKVDITNPQIVNGCQTVNSIAEVLKHNDDLENNFKDVYIMAKILVLKEKNKDFYRDIVKYTNSQNSINEKVFGATLQPFSTIQDKIKQQGFLLLVKQSDKHQFKEKYKDKKEKGILLECANKNSKDEFYEFKTIVDIQIPLETLIQIIGAFREDAHFAYTKKSFLLKPTSKEYYQNFSTKIGEFFTIESMVKLIVLYKKSEHDKKHSDDKKSPSPYYLLSFLGCYLESKEIDKQDFLKNITIENLITVYEGFKTLPSKYYKKYKEQHQLEYNQMIKQKVDVKIMGQELEAYFSNMKEHNSEKYEKLNSILDGLANHST